MADTATITDGIASTIVVATDKIGGVDYQRIKIGIGEDGTAVDLSASNPMPIAGSITVTGTMPVSVASGQQVDGHSANIGALADASSASTLTGLLKNIKAALAGALITELSTGLTPFFNGALSNTKTAVKASAGKLYGWMVHNPSAATAYIQVWNVAIGSITVGTTAPTYVIELPAGASANVMSERGITHSAEINIAATTTPTGSTAPGTALVVSLFYI